MWLISDSNKRRYAFKPVSCARSAKCIWSTGAGLFTQLEIEHHPLGRGHAGLTCLTAVSRPGRSIVEGGFFVETGVSAEPPAPATRWL